MRLLLTTTVLCFCSFQAFATSYFVSEVNSTEAGLNDSLKSLLTTAVNNAGGKVSASAEAADFVLRSEVVRLGGAYVLTVTRMKNGVSLNSSRQKAGRIEDLDDAADRAVRATMLATSTKSDLRVGEVKEDQENTLRRRIKSKNSTYVGFGPSTFNNMGTKPLSYDLGIGYNWEVTPNAAIRILGNGIMSNDWKTYLAFGGLGVNYLFTDADSSPYVGGLLGFGFSGSQSSKATTIGGFAANLGVGWQFFRTSSTQFDVFAGYTTIFGNNTIGAPGVYGVRIGILF